MRKLIWLFLILVVGSNSVYAASASIDLSKLVSGWYGVIEKALSSWSSYIHFDNNEVYNGLKDKKLGVYYIPTNNQDDPPIHSLNIPQNYFSPRYCAYFGPEITLTDDLSFGLLFNVLQANDTPYLNRVDGGYDGHYGFTADYTTALSHNAPVMIKAYYTNPGGLIYDIVNGMVNRISDKLIDKAVNVIPSEFIKDIFIVYPSEFIKRIGIGINIRPTHYEANINGKKWLRNSEGENAADARLRINGTDFSFKEATDVCYVDLMVGFGIIKKIRMTQIRA